MKIGRVWIGILLFGVGSLMAQESAKPIAAWRALCATDVSLETEALATLELGCATRVLFSEGGGDGRYFYPVNHPESVVARDAFDSWLIGEGTSKLEAWARGELAQEDEMYRPLFEAMALMRCDKGDLRNRAQKLFQRPKTVVEFDSIVEEAMIAYYCSVRTGGAEAMRKGYRGEALTESELDDLHGFRMLVEIAVRTPHHLPHELRLMRSTPANHSFDRGFQVGDTIPPFELPLLDTVLRRDAYQDEPYEYNPAAFLHRSSLSFFFDLFDGYELQGDELVAKPYVRPVGESAEESVRFPTSGKPLVLLTVRVTDGYWFRISAQDIIPLWYAYRGRVDFLVAHMTYSDPSVLAQEVMGPFAGKVTCLLHQVNQEMLAREAKVYWMSSPCFSLPTVVDTPSATLRNAMMTEGGDARTFICDVDGKLAFEFSKLIMEKPIFWAGGSIYGNVLVNRLDHLLANEGKNDGIPLEMNFSSPTYMDFENNIMASEEKDMVRASGTVQAIDPAAHTLLVEFKEKDQVFPITLQMGPHTLVEYAINWGRQEPSSFEAMKVGDAIQVDFRLSKTEGALQVRSEWQAKSDYVSYRKLTEISGVVTTRPDRVVFGQPVVAGVPGRPCVWSMGIVQSVDLDARTVTFINDAFVEYPTLGYQYWKTQSNARGNAETEASRKVITTWVEGSEEERTRTIHYSDGVFHFHHDRVADLETLKPGMKICALYSVYYDGLPVIDPYVIRSF